MLILTWALTAYLLKNLTKYYILFISQTKAVHIILLMCALDSRCVSDYNNTI
jgi:hypothetical protein